MTWRNFDNHRDEVKAVKKALAAVGINARVGHGRGTAWSWLHINIGEGQQFGDHDKESPDTTRWIPCKPGCKRCREMRRMTEMALSVAQEVSGRHGEYDGNINIHTQDHWSDKKGSIPIEHPNWKEDTPKPAPTPIMPLHLPVKEVKEPATEKLFANAMASELEKRGQKDTADQWREYAASIFV